MATVASAFSVSERPVDVLSGTPRAHAIDRWIFVFMAAWFIAIVLAGFIPDSVMKIELVRTGQRAPFPILMHMHAVLMGSFLLVLLAQTWLMATGRREYHMRLGVLAFVLAPALVIVGLLLAGAMYHVTWSALHTASTAELREKLQKVLSFQENIKLVQFRIAILFPLFLAVGLRARGRDAGLHKRMMILAAAMPLPAGIDRIPWLPSTLPESALSSDLYTLLAVSPMLFWDVLRNHSVHRAYRIWLGVNLPFALTLHALWDTAGWHDAVQQMMGV